MSDAFRNDLNLFHRIAATLPQYTGQPGDAVLLSWPTLLTTSTEYRDGYHAGIHDTTMLSGRAFQNWPPDHFDNLYVLSLVAKTLGGYTNHDPVPHKLRFRILKRDNYACQLCGATKQNTPNVLLHVDHKTARSNGGLNIEENLWTLCATCNIGKGTQDL